VKNTGCEVHPYINWNLHARPEVFTAVKIQVEVFWLATQCSVVTGYLLLKI
jgi:hypothetical protein